MPERRRCLTGPTLEGAREVRGIGIAQCHGGLGQPRLGPLYQAAGRLQAHLVEQLAVGEAEVHQTPLQGANTHARRFGGPVYGRIAAGERRGDPAPDLLRQIAIGGRWLQTCRQWKPPPTMVSRSSTHCISRTRRRRRTAIRRQNSDSAPKLIAWMSGWLGIAGDISALIRCVYQIDLNTTAR